MRRSLLPTAVAALAAAALVISLSPPADAYPGRGQARAGLGERTGQQSIVERLEQRGDFSTLLALLDANGLTAALDGDDDLTLFAPNDAAFGKLDQATLDFLDQNPDVLVQILLYHVAPGEKFAADLLRDTTSATLQGGPVLVTFENRTVFVNESAVVRPDLRARNGVVHEIDTVLTPPDGDVTVESIVDVLELDGRFGTLLQAVDAAGLRGALEDPDANITLLAPTDDAFAALGTATLEAVLGDLGLLTSILTYHVLPERLSAFDLLTRREAETLQGDTVTVRFRRGGLKVNTADVVAPNLAAPNGTIHVIDDVLLPPSD